MRHRFIHIAFAALLAACTGHDFEKPAPDTLVLGATTQDEIVAKYGPPYRQTTAIASNPVETRMTIQLGGFDRAIVSGTFASLSTITRTGQNRS
ncbi:MAG TPA: hypothetical protein VGB82_24240 [Alphaproteobacteria bacterium]